ALLYRLQVPGDVVDLLGDRVALEGERLEPGVGEDRDLTVVQVDDLARLGQDRRHVARDVVFVAVADPEQERAPPPRRDDLPRLVAAEDRDPVRSLDLPQGRANRFLELPRVGLFDQVGKDLRVRLRPELVAQLLQLATQRTRVLDDPVVDHRETAGAVGVRVRVRRGRRAVRGPPGMRDPARTL